MTRKFLSLLAILYGLIYFFYESWYPNFGQSVLNLSIDYLAIILLLAAVNGQSEGKQRRGASMRSLGLYRMPHDESLCLEARRTGLGIEESKVMSLLIFAIAVSTVAFAASLILSFSRRQK